MEIMTLQHSPLQSWHASRCENWCQLGKTSLPRYFVSPEQERVAAADLALCDLSGLPLIEFKGPGAADWLSANGLSVPAEIYQGNSTTSDGWLTRTGSDEFLLRGSTDNRSTGLPLNLPDNRYQQDLLITTRQDALLLLTGQRINQLMGQTCGLDYDQLPSRETVFTRVAAVSCGLLKDQLADYPVCWLWIDPSQALYLWHELVQIIEDLAGHVVGAGCFCLEVD